MGNDIEFFEMLFSLIFDSDGNIHTTGIIVSSIIAIICIILTIWNFMNNTKTSVEKVKTVGKWGFTRTYYIPTGPWVSLCCASLFILSCSIGIYDKINK